MPGPGEGIWPSDGGGVEPRRRGWLHSLAGLLSDLLAAESERWFLWIPVLFGGGIIAYFSLPVEPGFRAALALLIAASGLLLAFRHAPLGLALGGAVLAFACGFATAKLRTEFVREPVLAKDMRGAELTGFVEAVDPRDKGRARLTVRVISLGQLPPEETPYRVRVSISANKIAGAVTGACVSLKATLQPLPEPVEPGGFDFGRVAWFERLGATGYAIGDPKFDDLTPPPWDLAIWASIDRVRNLINARIRAVLTGQTGEIAAALVTGARGGISDQLNQAMRDSGLYHILSISGVHMVIMAGTVMWVVRGLLALVPGVALRFPIRKWAAGVALVTALLYLLLSGAAVPTVRSWIMISVVLLAVMLGRPALTMRNVAMAALAILIASPESVFDPSFEMSFAAVVGLVALYERLPEREPSGGEVSPVWRVLGKGWVMFFAAALTTLVATAATTPFAVYHFHRVTYYGLFANLLVEPIVSFLIMPMGLLAIVAMPFSLEAWPLKAMGLGVNLMVWIGEWIAAWPGAVSVLPAISGSGLVLIVLGGLWICLWQTPWRALGLVIAAGGLALAPNLTRPDVLIDRDGRIAAFRGDDGNLSLPPATLASYSADNWLLADGDGRDTAAAAAASDTAFRCDILGCIGRVKGKLVALVRDPAALEEDCRNADIIVAPFSVGRRCRAARVVIDRKALKTEGASALYIDGQSIRTETVAEARGDRPWVREHPEIALPDTSGHAYAHGNGFDDEPAEESDGRSLEDPDR